MHKLTKSSKNLPVCRGAGSKIIWASVGYHNININRLLLLYFEFAATHFQINHIYQAKIKVFSKILTRLSYFVHISRIWAPKFDKPKSVHRPRNRSAGAPGSSKNGSGLELWGHLLDILCLTL